MSRRFSPICSNVRPRRQRRNWKWSTARRMTIGSFKWNKRRKRSLMGNGWRCAVIGWHWVKWLVLFFFSSSSFVYKRTRRDAVDMCKIDRLFRRLTIVSFRYVVEHSTSRRTSLLLLSDFGLELFLTVDIFFDLDTSSLQSERCSTCNCWNKHKHFSISINKRHLTWTFSMPSCKRCTEDRAMPYVVSLSLLRNVEASRFSNDKRVKFWTFFGIIRTLGRKLIWFCNFPNVKRRNILRCKFWRKRSKLDGKFFLAINAMVRRRWSSTKSSFLLLAIKQYIVSLVISHSQTAEAIEREKVYLNKLDIILVQVNSSLEREGKRLSIRSSSRF